MNLKRIKFSNQPNEPNFKNQCKIDTQESAHTRSQIGKFQKELLSKRGIRFFCDFPLQSTHCISQKIMINLKTNIEITLWIFFHVFFRIFNRNKICMMQDQIPQNWYICKPAIYNLWNIFFLLLKPWCVRCGFLFYFALTFNFFPGFILSANILLLYYMFRDFLFR